MKASDLFELVQFAQQMELMNEPFEKVWTIFKKSSECNQLY